MVIIGVALHIFVTVPIFETAADTVAVSPAAWLGMEYNRTISNSLKDDKKEELYQLFLNDSQREFYNHDDSNFVYLSRLGHSDKKDGFIQAVRNNKIYLPNQTIL